MGAGGNGPVIEAVMPEGVEHQKAIDGLNSKIDKVIEAVMPEGVEHEIVRGGVEL